MREEQHREGGAEIMEDGADAEPGVRRDSIGDR